MIEGILLTLVFMGCLFLIIGTIGKMEREEELKHIETIIKGLRYDENIRRIFANPVKAPNYVRTVRDACQKEYGAGSLAYRAFLELKAVIEEDLHKERTKNREGVI